MESKLTTWTATGGDGAVFSPPHKQQLQEFFRLRLAHLMSLNETAELTTQQRRLLDRALFSTYLDCAELDLLTQAREMLGLLIS